MRNANSYLNIDLLSTPTWYSSTIVLQYNCAQYETYLGHGNWPDGTAHVSRESETYWKFIKQSLPDATEATAVGVRHPC
jgi:hypothetical protein